MSYDRIKNEYFVKLGGIDLESLEAVAKFVRREIKDDGKSVRILLNFVVGAQRSPMTPEEIEKVEKDFNVVFDLSKLSELADYKPIERDSKLPFVRLGASKTIL